MSDVVLTAAMNANLLSLQNTQTLLNQTQLRLSTGLKVNSALDNPSSYFAAQSLNNRASDLSSLLDSMGQSVQTVQAANNGLTSITSYLQQALALAKTALANANGNATTAGANANHVTDQASYDAIMTQIDQVAADSNYQGISLIANATSTLKVQFNETNTNSLTITATDNTSTGLAVKADTLGTGVAGDAATIQTTINDLNAAIATVRTNATSLSNNLSIIQTRQDFTQNIVNTLQAGANDLTVADKNAEGAKLLSLQTTQQLGITSLSLASQANQAILRLFP